MNQEIYDYALSNFLHKIIKEELPVNQQIQLKTLASCGRKVSIPKTGVAGVFLVSNNSKSKFFGTTMCKNPFACPCCSAHRMSVYSKDIANGLDYLRSQGYFGFMMTFSIPHLRYMKCRDITNILYETYSYFRRTAKQQNYRKKVNGELGQRTKTISGQFYEDCKIEHSVTVCEYTYGKNGWHPHFHAIFWTKRENIHKVLSWQKALNEFWLYHAERIMKKYWQEHKLSFKSDKISDWSIDKLFANAEKDAGIYISQKDGVLTESLSSDYISGWGANREVTGNYRKTASHSEHLTPYQILEKAYNGDQFYKKIYIEFCLAVTQKPVHHRVMWSQTGIKKLIKVYSQQIKCTELIKKKESEKEKWAVLLWFNKSQWYELLEFEKNSPILANILYLAKLGNKQILYEFLDGLGIEYSLPESNYLSSLVEDIFNCA